MKTREDIKGFILKIIAMNADIVDVEDAPPYSAPVDLWTIGAPGLGVLWRDDETPPISIIWGCPGAVEVPEELLYLALHGSEHEIVEAVGELIEGASDERMDAMEAFTDAIQR